MLTIFGKRSCPRCVKLMQILENKRVPTEYKEIPHDASKEEVELLIRHQIKSVPIIWDGFVEINSMVYLGGE